MPNNISPDIPASILKRVLSKWDALAINIAIVIGIGIFRVPSEIAQYFHGNGPLILLAWFVGGLISMLGAFCYAELSSMFPETGGDYVFLRKGYGKLLAFLYAWTELIIIRTGSIAAISFLFADYACGLLGLNKGSNKLIALTAIVSLLLVNLLGLNSVRKIQSVLSLTKVVSLILLVCGALFFAKGDISRITAAPNLSFDLSTISLFALALIPVLWTYGGWQENTFVAGETTEASKSVPFALVGTIIVTSGIYLLMNAAFLYIMPAEKMCASPLIAADVFRAVYGEPGGKLLEFVVVLYAIGTINAIIITGSRITYAMAQDNPIFKVLTTTTGKNATPVAAMILNSLGACVFVIVGSFDRLLFFTGIAVWLFFALVGCSLFIFRKRYPDKLRPFISPGYPWLPACFVIVCLGLCLNSFFMYTQQSLIGLAIVLGGIPIYYCSQYFMGKNKDAVN